MKIKKFIARILTKASILIFCISLLFIQNTVGYFQDIEVSQGNTIETGTLDLGLRSGQSNFVSGADSMEPGDSVTRDIYVQNLGNNPFSYKASYEYVSGDEDLCEGLQLRVWYNWYDAEPPALGDHSTRHMDLKYFGPLANFDDFDTNSPTHDPDMVLPNVHPYYNNIFYQDNEHWFYYQVVLPQGTGYLLGKSCTFNIKVKAWQVGLEESESGFWDEEVIESTIGTAQRCGEGEAVDVAPIDRVNIGDELSEQLHDIDGWSSPNLPGGYGGGSDDGTYRQVIEETSCNDDGREAKFVLYAGSRNVNLLRIRALDGLSNLDSFEVYVNGNLVGAYTDVQDSAEVWHSFEIPLNNLSGRLEVVLKATDEIWSGCSQYGQVAISWAEIDGYYCSPDEEIIPDSTEASCQESDTPVTVDPIDEVNVGDITSESGYNLVGWSSANLPGDYGGKDDGTYRQVISEQYCSDEYRVAGFTINAGSQIANLLRLRVLDGISNKDGFDVYVNDEFLAHLPDLTQNHGENWQTYEIPLPDLTGEIKVRLVAFDEFWNLCQTYGQVSVSWAQIAGYSCGEAASTDNLVINEVYYDVDSAHQEAGTENHNEWIELYNAGPGTVDISGWVIEDDGPAASADIIPPTSPIAPDTFVVITPHSSTWDYWPSIPPGAVKIVLTSTDTKIGNGLNNQGDKVILKDSGGNVVDAMSYGNDNSVWNPDCPDVTTGHSLARSPKGYDTDQASDFVNLDTPNPGTNPHPPASEQTEDEDEPEEEPAYESETEEAVLEEEKIVEKEGEEPIPEGDGVEVIIDQVETGEVESAIEEVLDEEIQEEEVEPESEEEVLPEEPKESG